MKSTPPRSHGTRRQQAKSSPFARQLVLPGEKYIHNEAISGGLIFIGAAIAIFWANSPWSDNYFALRAINISFNLGNFEISEDLQHWVSDGLMSIFFFVVALEIKREFVFGSLSQKSKAMLPIAAALGGMIIPVGLYVLLNREGEGFRGWGIPMATDIAFAVAVLALLGEIVPHQLKILLLAIAIVDDVGAILVIAVYYTNELSSGAIQAAFLFLGIILAARWVGILNMGIYVLLGIGFWAAVLKSGIHPTIAGVVLGILTPSRSTISPYNFIDTAIERLPEIREALREGQDEELEANLGSLEESLRETESPLERLERMVHPWVNFTILPVFAFLNAGFVLTSSLIPEAFSNFVTLGILLGFMVGKPVGVFGFAYLAVKMGIATLPENINWKQMAGLSVISGVGFTVALFITGLAFEENSSLVPMAQIGIVTASVVMALFGYLILRMTVGRKNNDRSDHNNDDQEV